MKSPPLVILCLDLALANTGVSVIAVNDSQDTLLHVNTIHTEKSDKATIRKNKMRTSDDEWRRTKELCVALKQVIVQYTPKHIFIECPTGGSKSANAAKSMAIARGVACAVITGANIPVTLVTPFEAKRAATGDPSASKQQVKEAVLKCFPLFDGWLRGKRGQVIAGPNEHIYDSLSVYMASKNTQFYKDLKNDSR